MTSPRVLAGAAQRIRSAPSTQEWLTHTWERLNRYDPPVTFDLELEAASGPRVAALARTVTVEPHQLTGSGEAAWGQLDYRPDACRDIVEKLLEADRAGRYDAWLAWYKHLRLAEDRGPYGPLYSMLSDGRHRIHTARALEVPLTMTAVDCGPDTTPGSRCAFPTSGRSGTRREQDQDRRLHRRMRLLADAGLVADLCSGEEGESRREVISFTVAEPLPAPWALESPASVESLSRRYRRSYPQFGQHVTEAAMMDRDKWVRWLRDRAARRARRGVCTQSVEVVADALPVDGPQVEAIDGLVHFTHAGRRLRWVSRPPVVVRSLGQGVPRPARSSTSADHAPSPGRPRVVAAGLDRRIDVAAADRLGRIAITSWADAVEDAVRVAEEQGMDRVVVPIPGYPDVDARPIFRKVRQALEWCEEVGENAAMTVTLLIVPPR